MENEIWLSVDLSTRAGSLALHRFDSGGLPSLLSARSFEEDSKHSEMLLCLIEELLVSQNLKLGDVSRLIASSGPGSFTGLRIALASLKALAMAKQISLELVSSSEARARAFRQRNASVAKDLSIVTRVASGSYTIANLSGNAFTEETQNLSNTFALVDSENSAEYVKGHGIKELAMFPSLAQYLGETLPDCVTRRTSSSIEELVAATPNYFGSTRF